MKKMTNLEYIRTLDAKEFINWLEKFYRCDCCVNTDKCEMHSKEICDEGLEKWFECEMVNRLCD